MNNRIVGGIVLAAGLFVSWPRTASADAILQWNINAGEAAKAACLSPEGNGLAEARLYAMVHVATHDALNAIERRSQPYAFDDRALGRASRSAAIAAAARDVLVSVISQLQESSACVQNGLAATEAAYAAALAAVPDGDAKTAGVSLGQAAAAAIVQVRTMDGSDAPLQDFAYPQGTQPGEYRFTPELPFAFATQWGKVRPFVLKRASQFRSGPPYKVDSRKYTADFNEVKSLGGDGFNTPTERREEQSEIGLFWKESSPLAWNRIARDVSARARLSMHENARLFGLLNMAMADGYIASWEAKYHYNFWRPVTAIHLAATDGNPDTVADPTWTPLQLTYPMPDHDSGHAVQGGVAAEVLKRFFGTDRIAFRACSLTLAAQNTCAGSSPRFRRYRAFSQAADENAVSRILLGIHFRRAVEEGTEHGRKIGRRAVNVYMRPVHH